MSGSAPASGQRSARRHAARVAALTTALLTALYVIVAVVLDVTMSQRLTHQVDQRLAAALASIGPQPLTKKAVVRAAEGDDLDDAPVVIWLVDRAGRSRAIGAGIPALPRSARVAAPVTVRLSGDTFRLAGETLSGGARVVVGQSLAGVGHVRSVLLLGEGLLAPFIVVATFLLSFAIGARAAGPVEKTRLRQLEFSADASHELRTPLSVIEAEVGLALSTERRASYYRESLERIGGESKRLHQIVENLLWLARFDAEPPPPVSEPLDLVSAVATCTERFEALAASRSVTLSAQREGSGPALVGVAPEWMDRLLGVLVDNALRYSPAGGEVRITVGSTGPVVRLVVEDNGPGIPAEERERLFERFHRASTLPGGAGLGLAIADAVVRSTRGSWDVGVSASGGARFEVSWRRGPRGRRASPPLGPPPGLPASSPLSPPQGPSESTAAPDRAAIDPAVADAQRSGPERGEGGEVDEGDLHGPVRD